MAPRPINESAPLTAPPPNPGLRPDVIEAIEDAVVRLLAARRNIVTGIVEFHPRRDEDPSENTWRRLRQSLLNAESTATGKPTGLALVPGSVISSASYLDIVGEPWLAITSTGKRTVHAQLRVGELPDPSWTLALEADVAGSSRPEPFTCGDSIGSRAPGARTATKPLVDCLKEDVSLSAGQSIVLSLRLGDATAGAPDAMQLHITFPEFAGLAPLLRDVAVNAVRSVPVSTSDPGGPLHQTLSCLLDPTSSVSREASILRFKDALTEGGKAGVTLRPAVSGGAGSAMDGAVIVVGPGNGIWIHPTGIDWSRVKKDVIEAGLVRERAIPIEHLLAPGEPLHGVPLFPIAFAGPELPDGIGRLLSTPLVPQRRATLSPGANPAQTLLEPRSARILLPYARPVAFSALPMLRSDSLLNAHALSVVPLAWRIDLPPSPGGKRGGLLWYFDLDPVKQGLLLPRSCLPERPSVEFFCERPSGEVQTFEPVYDETRFFAIWLAVLRAARLSAVAWRDNAEPPRDGAAIPVFMTHEMLSRARVASSSGGLLMLAAGLTGQAVFLIFLRLRQRSRNRLL